MEIQSVSQQKLKLSNKVFSKMKRVLLFLVIIYFINDASGQKFNLDSIFEPRLSGVMFQAKTGVRGKQFFNDEWTAGDIKLYTGERVFNKQIKYNGLMDELIWLQADSFRQITLEKHFIDEFQFKNFQGRSPRFKRYRALLSGLIDSSDIFVEVLVENIASLYVFRNIKSEGTENSLEGGVLYSYEILIPRPLYFLILPDRETVTLKKIRRRIVLNALPDRYKNSIKEIIRQNHLSMRTEDDLTRLINLIN
jgi:hypothetical protein